MINEERKAQRIRDAVDINGKITVDDHFGDFQKPFIVLIASLLGEKKKNEYAICA